MTKLAPTPNPLGTGPPTRKSRRVTPERRADAPGGVRTALRTTPITPSVEEFFLDSVSSVFVLAYTRYSDRFSTVHFFTRAFSEILFSQYLDLRESQRHQTYVDYRHGHCLSSQRFGFGIPLPV